MGSLLVLGGARSGKSDHARRWIEAQQGSLCFVATAQAHDGEMAERIARHRAERGARWHAVEAPLELVGAMQQAAQDHDAVLVDCLTLWQSNLMFADADMALAADRLAALIVAFPKPLAIVANEVGLGIVPDNALARRFRDEAGRLNQRVAQVVDEVVFTAAGLPLRLK